MTAAGTLAWPFSSAAAVLFFASDDASFITAVAEFVGMLAIAVVVAKLSRQAIRPLATALALQRRFVDDASHELRARVTDTGD
jgi:signal transduction histidine kinase